MNVVTDKEYYDEVEKSAFPIVVIFTSPFCPSCQVMSSIYDELEEERKHYITFLKINIEQSKEVKNTFGVSDIPTIAIVIEGEPCAVFKGFAPKNILEDTIDLFC